MMSGTSTIRERKHRTRSYILRKLVSRGILRLEFQTFLVQSTLDNFGLVVDVLGLQILDEGEEQLEYFDLKQAFVTFQTHS